MMVENGLNKIDELWGVEVGSNCGRTYMQEQSDA